MQSGQKSAQNGHLLAEQLREITVKRRFSGYKLIFPPGKVRKPLGKVRQPPGKVRQPPGKVRKPPDKVTLPDGKFTLSGGKITRFWNYSWLIFPAHRGCEFRQMF
jgi:hypothetical protein